MNQRQYDLVSISVDNELQILFEESEDAWFGERRNYAQETTEHQTPAPVQEGQGKAEELLRDIEEARGGETADVGPGGQGPAGEVAPPRSKAPNYYGPPE
jgi:hypothetical protein